MSPKKKMEYESISCLCGSNEFGVLTTMDRHNLPQITSLCAQCGLMLNNPRLDEASYDFFYSSGLYRDLYEGETAFTNKEVPTKEAYGQTILEFLRKNNPISTANKKVLEIGCNVGRTLYALKKEGWHVAGIEPDARACEMGNVYDLNIKCGRIEDFSGENEFDLIVMTEVFEHFLNPEMALEKIKTFLKPEGVNSLPDMEKYKEVCPSSTPIQLFIGYAYYGFRGAWVQSDCWK